eukprot:scaffold480_cov257-Pinguiococcus_pyrenoidosus.AAC.3
MFFNTSNSNWGGGELGVVPLPAAAAAEGASAAPVDHVMPPRAVLMDAALPPALNPSSGLTSDFRMLSDAFAIGLMAGRPGETRI